MSFGVSVGDFIAISDLAWRVYRACKDSSASFASIANDAASLHIILRETAELVTLAPSYRAGELEVLQKGCRDVLDDLEKLVKKYERMATNTQRAWDRLRFGAEDLEELRNRLVAQVSLLTAFNTSYQLSSQHRLEVKLDKFIMEIRSGLREGSVASTITSQSVEDDKSELWAQLSRELVDVGVTPEMLAAHKSFIREWFTKAFASGVLMEGSPVEVRTVHARSELDSGGDGIPPVEVEANLPRPRYELPDVEAYTEPERALPIIPPEYYQDAEKELYVPPQPVVVPVMTPDSITGHPAAQHYYPTDATGYPTPPVTEGSSSIHDPHDPLEGHAFSQNLIPPPNTADPQGADELPSYSKQDPSKHLVQRSLHNKRSTRFLVAKFFGGHKDRLIKAIKASDLPAAKAVVYEGVLDLTKPWGEGGQTALMHAVQHKAVEIVRFLIPYSNVDAFDGYGSTPLMQAIKASAGPQPVTPSDNDNGYDAIAEIVTALIAAGADINKICAGATPVFAAVEANNIPVLRLLLHAGADPNVRCRMALVQGLGQLLHPVHLAACKYPDTEILQLLLLAGADINARDQYDNTPLLIAAGAGFVDVVLVLTEAGVDIQARNHKHFNALHLAAQGRDAYRFSSGRFPVRKAESNTLPLLQVLVSAGIDVNSVDAEGNTPLHWAAGLWKAEIAKALLALGAKLDVLNLKGQGPIESAKQDPQISVVEWARKAHGNQGDVVAVLMGEDNGMMIAKELESG